MERRQIQNAVFERDAVGRPIRNNRCQFGMLIFGPILVNLARISLAEPLLGSKVEWTLAGVPATQARAYESIG